MYDFANSSALKRRYKLGKFYVKRANTRRDIHFIFTSPTNAVGEASMPFTIKASTPPNYSVIASTVYSCMHHVHESKWYSREYIIYNIFVQLSVR